MNTSNTLNLDSLVKPIIVLILFSLSYLTTGCGQTKGSTPKDTEISASTTGAAPVTDTPVVNAPAENTPVVNAPAENTTVVNAPAENTPVVNAPATDLSLPAANTPANTNINTPEEAVNITEHPEESEKIESIELEASYENRKFQNDDFFLNKIHNIQIPAEIIPSEGNAKNSKFTLSLGGVVCDYIATNSNKNTKLFTFIFQKCTDSLGKVLPVKGNNAISVQGYIKAEITDAGSNSTLKVHFKLAVTE